MELIILLIKLIAKAFDSGAKSPTAPSDAARQMDLARQIQQRIEEARARAAQEQQAQQEPSRPMTARLPPPIQRPVKSQKVIRKQTGRQPTPQRGAAAKTFKRKGKRSAPPPLPSRAAISAAPAMATSAATQTPAPAAVRRPPIPNADAKLLARWLRPQTLRSQFILTEVFQPPLALREQHLF